MKTKKFTLILTCMLTFAFIQAHAQASCNLGKPADNMPEGFSQFKFIIGDFDVNYRVWKDGKWSEPLTKARWNGRYTLDGRAIMDWWYDDAGAGVNIRMYDPEKDLWKTAWNYTAGIEVRELHQKIWKEDGKLHLWQVYPEAPERNVYFETYEDGRWARISQKKNKETGVWEPAVMLEAIPAKCEVRN